MDEKLEKLIKEHEETRQNIYSYFRNKIMDVCNKNNIVFSAGMGTFDFTMNGECISECDIEQENFQGVLDDAERYPGDLSTKTIERAKMGIKITELFLPIILEAKEVEKEIDDNYLIAGL